MEKLIRLITCALSCPVAMFAGIAAISVFSLAMALVSEVAFGLEPCILCVYQRFPFVIATILSLTGILLCKANKEKWHGMITGLMGLNALAFLTNSAIAFYHTGVEQKWWVSAVEGCAVPDFGEEAQSIIENILSAPTANCAEIPWQDPIIGLSMANYNVLLCFGLFILCLLSFVRLRQRRACSTET